MLVLSLPVYTVAVCDSSEEKGSYSIGRGRSRGLFDYQLTKNEENKLRREEEKKDRGCTDKLLIYRGRRSGDCTVVSL